MKEQIIEILKQYLPQDMYINDFDDIAADLKKLYQQTYLNDCIEKATPNLSKIKDVDKELAEIRGNSKVDLKKKFIDFLIWYQPDNEVAEDIVSKYIMTNKTSPTVIDQQMKGCLSCKHEDTCEPNNECWDFSKWEPIK